jgi:Arm DNA-binding domain
MTMASKQITKRLIDGLKPRVSEYFVWDGTLAGYGVRVQTTGAMSYVVKYRAGSGRTAPTRRLTLAKVGTFTPDEARTLAKKTLGSVPTVPIRLPSGPPISAHPPLLRSPSNSSPSM